MIKKRGDGYWIRIYLGRGEDGKAEYYHETLYVPLKSMAQDRERELIRKLKPGKIGLRTGMTTLAQWMDAWLLDVKESVAPRTFITYTYNVKRLKPLIGSLQLWDLSSEKLNDALRGQFEDLKPRSKRNLYSFTHTVVKAAADAKKVPTDALQGFKLPRVPKIHRETIGREQMRRLIEVAAAFRYGLVIRLLVLTGARAGEILGLTWDAVDFTASTITINKSIDTKTKVLNDRPKTENSRRKIVLDDVTIQLLKELQDLQKTELRALAVVPLNLEKGLVFQTVNGNPVCYKTVRQTFASCLKKAGIQHMRVHDLRHSLITLLLTEGNSLVNVASLVGQDPNTTTGKYTHLLKISNAIIL